MLVYFLSSANFTLLLSMDLELQKSKAAKFMVFVPWKELLKMNVRKSLIFTYSPFNRLFYLWLKSKTYLKKWSQLSCTRSKPLKTLHLGHLLKEVFLQHLKSCIYSHFLTLLTFLTFANMLQITRNFKSSYSFLSFTEY